MREGNGAHPHRGGHRRSCLLRASSSASVAALWLGTAPAAAAALRMGWAGFALTLATARFGLIMLVLSIGYLNRLARHKDSVTLLCSCDLRLTPHLGTWTIRICMDIYTYPNISRYIRDLWISSMDMFPEFGYLGYPYWISNGISSMDIQHIQVDHRGISTVIRSG